VDFGGCARAVERATELILACCGGSAGPLSDVKGALPSRDAVRVRPARVTRLLGVDFAADTISALFGRLGFSSSRDGDDFLVTPPSYRFDLAIEEDFVEEVARLHGFDAIPWPCHHSGRRCSPLRRRRVLR
jgi:phenylalanyl-tRNA synthetase beta chain